MIRVDIASPYRNLESKTQLDSPIGRNLESKTQLDSSIGLSAGTLSRKHSLIPLSAGHHILDRGAHMSRKSVLSILLVLGVFLPASKPAEARTLTFEDRVNAQRAIEQVD